MNAKKLSNTIPRQIKNAAEDGIGYPEFLNKLQDCPYFRTASFRVFAALKAIFFFAGI